MYIVLIQNLKYQYFFFNCFTFKGIRLLKRIDIRDYGNRENLKQLLAYCR